MAHISMVTLGVTDIERSARFYEAMGWERSSTSVEDRIVFLRGGATVLALYGTESLQVDAGATVTSVLATNVATSDVVDTFLAAADRAGGVVTKPARTTDWGGYSGDFADPDGHVWEVAQNPHAVLEDDGRMLLADDPRVSEEDLRDPRAELEAFRARVDASEGPSSDALARAAADLLDDAIAGIRTLFGGHGNDRIIAAMSLLTELGVAEAPASMAGARYHAASTLVGSLLVSDA